MGNEGGSGGQVSPVLGSSADEGKYSDAVAKDDGSSNPSATSRESKYPKGLAEVGN